MRKKKGKWKPYGKCIKKPYDVNKDIPEDKDWSKEIKRINKLKNNNR